MRREVRVRAEREIMSPLTAATTTTSKEPTRRTSTTSLSCLKQAKGSGQKGLRAGKREREREGAEKRRACGGKAKVSRMRLPVS